MSVFKRSAEQYLGITSDLTNTTVDATTVYVTGDLQVTGSISSGGSTGATGSGDLEVTGDLIVDQHSYLDGKVNMANGMGCTGNAEFFGQVRARGYLFGIMEYLYLAVNNANSTYTAVGNAESIINAMDGASYESSSNGITISGSGVNGTYIQPVAAGMYVMSFFARLKDDDVDQVNGVIPYIYARDLSPASWIVSTNQPQYVGALYGGRITINYEQLVYIPSGGDKRVDLRASTESGTFNIAFGTFGFRYVSSI